MPAHAGPQPLCVAAGAAACHATLARRGRRRGSRCHGGPTTSPPGPWPRCAHPRRQQPQSCALAVATDRGAWWCGSSSDAVPWEHHRRHRHRLTGLRQRTRPQLETVARMRMAPSTVALPRRVLGVAPPSLAKSVALFSACRSRVPPQGGGRRRQLDPPPARNLHGAHPPPPPLFPPGSISPPLDPCLSVGPPRRD